MTIKLAISGPMIAVASPATEIGVISVLLLAAVAVALAGTALVLSLRWLRGTTLRAPAVWALVSLAAMVVIQAALLRASTYKSTREKFDLIAATSTFCPLVSLLGAKRPQNRVWQWIVLTFWAIAAFPAVESLIVQPGEWMDLHPLWQWFYAILIVAGCANYLPTRFWLSALLVAWGQCALMCDFLPGASHWLAPLRSTVAFDILPEMTLNGRRDYRLWQMAAGMVPLAVAVCWAYVVATKRRRTLVTPLAGLDRVWLDFRDAYGVLWALRVLDRIAGLAHRTGAMVKPTWSGFHLISSQGRRNVTPADENPNNNIAPRVDSLAPLERGLSMLLLRFVSRQWINARMQGDAVIPQPE